MDVSRDFSPLWERWGGNVVRGFAGDPLPRGAGGPMVRTVVRDPSRDPSRPARLGTVTIASLVGAHTPAGPNSFAARLRALRASR
jgi:hypothetical protein